MKAPLSDVLRPKALTEFVGQEHLTGTNGQIHNLLSLRFPPSMIFWGPPGSGKTTLANIIVTHFHAQWKMINAVSSGVKEVREMIELGQKLKAGNNLFVLFIDEIHRFNRSQQASLLNGIENGDIILIAATTENPSFTLINALLSRVRVLQFYPLEIKELILLAKKVIAYVEAQERVRFNVDKEIFAWLVSHCSFDARRLINMTEDLIYHSLLPEKEKSRPAPTEENVSAPQLHVSWDKLKEMLPSHFLNYDAKGDWHYDLISAFIKSVRGSDPDAALYYLAWMLAGGEDPLFIARRLLILASEDVGLANSRALIFAQAAYQAVKEIGMPEARIILAEAAIYLASSPKSNSAYLAIEKALSRVRAGKSREPVIPFHLRNSPTNFMKDLGYGKNYHYPHDHEHHFIYEKYLPEEVAQEEFYQPTTMGAEKSLAEYLAFLWPGRFGPR